ncbi:unnamed protein product [Arabidopsis arenosa]|uniref:Uncharacterized protein n=1 Tax=Arabidopsis arenosa TaxID=38785 RepID=A0A8S2B6U2_ARAAE|nr:unnamed protein product [Arabidopsis arenosa]
MADSEQLVCISCVSEVRYSFVSHLSEALRRKGIYSVIIDVDSDDLLSKESQAKIEISRVSVMVLSRICEPTRVCQNFVNVIECQRNKNQVVVPVLYGESPLLGEWLSVLDLRDFSPVHQSRKECSDSQLVKEIVRDVYEKLFYKGRIGIYSKLLEIEKMVCKQPLGIRCVGIWDDMTEQNLHEVSMKVIKYADGHPLALNIYGRELKGKKGPPEMEIAFLELKERPPTMFVDAIKSCYDTLNDREKNIFLDIACFFQGENVDYVMQLLEGCGFFPHVGIDVLVEKCLVTITENQVRMHNLIQNVGRQIINRETRQTKRRDRLWEPWSIKYLLEDNGEKENGEHKTTLERAQGPEEIEGMFLDTSNLSFDIKPAAFDNMLNLRLLKIYSSNPEVHHVKNFLKGSLNSLPNELRLLHWENYPLQFLPQNFDPIHLVEINMPYSQLKKLWGGTKNLEMLNTIRLCHSQQLVDIDDVLKAQNLEVIDLQGCTRLQSFPATGQLLHLRIVNLSGCTEIKSFPEIPPNIETLNLQGTGIIELPLSIIKPNYTELLNLLAEIPGLSGVSNLEQSDLKPLTSLMKMSTSNQNLGKLICLELKDCARLRSLPNMNNLELLKVLDLSGCSELETIQGFPQNLKELYLAGTAVRQVPQLPQSLELFNAHGCVSLKSIRLDFEKLPVHYTLSNCFDLCPKVVSDFLVQALANAKRIPREHQQELNKTLAFSFCAPSHANQNSKLDLQPGSSVMTRLNYSWRNTLVGFAILVEVAFSEAYSEATGFGISCVCRWKNKEGHSHRIERNLHCWDLGKAFQKDHMFVFFDVNMRPGTDEGSEPDIWADLVVFEFFPVNNQTKPLDDSCTVTRCGVRVITAVNCNTSIENISPVLSLDPMEVSGNEESKKTDRLVDNIQTSMIDPKEIEITGSQNRRKKSKAKKVVCVVDPGSRSSEVVVPSDLWVWRKYGQKPLKGSPYPRNYYRCTSSIGCSARKHVERSRTDPNMLVITYISEHNHPSPTQRKALAGSTRSPSSSKCSAVTTSDSSRVSQHKDEPDKSHLPSSPASPPYADMVIKEDMRRWYDMEFNDDVADTFTPQFFPEDIFADLDKLESNSQTMFLAHSSSGGNMENQGRNSSDDMGSFVVEHLSQSVLVKIEEDFEKSLSEFVVSFKNVFLLELLIWNLDSATGNNDTLDIQRGATLFNRACIGCHDTGGNIIQPGATLFTKDLERNGVDTEEEIYRVTYFGKGRMPGFGEKCTPRGQCTFGPRLQDEEIKLLAEFVKFQADQGWPNVSTD